MNPETKQCQNCKSDFDIEAEDFEFYKKISVPAPTFCSECRLQRRLSFFNLTTLHKRECGMCSKSVISIYHPKALCVVYCPKCWWSDTWDFQDYAKDYNFDIPFFEQLSDLSKETPLLGLSLGVECLENSPYNNHAGDLNRCYLTFQSAYCEDVFYSLYSFHNRNIMDSNNIGHCERCYDVLHGFKSTNCIGCYNIAESIDCYFMRDCNNCQDCFGCTNLRNKKNCWFNEQLSKEDYFKKLNQYDFGSHKEYVSAYTKAREFWKTQAPRPVHIEMSPESTGNYIFESSNCKNSFDSSNAQDCKNIFMCTIAPIKDCYDVTCFGEGMQSCYESCGIGLNTNKVLFSLETGIDVIDVLYCQNSVRDVRDCFGCVSARKAQYCILNKQYEKGEYEKIVLKIKEQMNNVPYIDKKGNIYKYGEFFPPETSLLAYRDTLANIFFQKNVNEVNKEGYTLYPDQDNQYKITIQAKELPDNIDDVDDSILEQVISCIKTGKAYQIQMPELQFLRQMNLPLPRVAPIERILEKTRLWAKEIDLIERESSLSGDIFMTPYAKEDAPYILSPEEYKQEFLG